MSADKPEKQKRQHTRYQLRAHASLINGNGEWQAHLLNLSANGALVALLDTHDIQAGDDVRLDIKVGVNQQLNLSGVVAHVKAHYLGIRCKTNCIENHDLLEQLMQNFEKGEATKVKYGL